MNPPKISALTIDLDDTLWPVWPVIDRAEHRLHAWLQQHAPAMALAMDVAGLRRLRDQVASERPEWAHDFTAIRMQSLRQGLALHGHSPDLAEPAFEAFFAARHEVEFYADVQPALRRLASRFPLFALSNGNADLQRVGLSPWFAGGVNAKQAGVGKPHPDIFVKACAALRLPAQQVLHVGDDLDLDVAGALGAGLHAVWVCREDTAHAARPAPDGVAKLSDLAALADWLGC
jgi:FMN hydrolase / 5-amino-6-(5-phospho-D-ribitylamino)uracil phosphatase